MALAVVVPGPVLVRTGTGTSSALEDLGYSINGVEVDEEPVVIPVPGDQNGGDQGIPIDEQKLGEVHIIRMELTNMDAAVVAKVGAKELDGTTGEIGDIGSLYAGGSLYYRVLLLGDTVTRNYLACRPLRMSAPYGSKYLRQTIEWIARPVSGVLYNSTDS